MRILGILFLVLLAQCGASATAGRSTRVSRERLLVTGEPARDAYFLAVHGHQQALAGVDMRRADLSAALAVALQLRVNADRATLAAALRAELDRVHVQRVRVRVEPAADLDERVSSWHATLTERSAEGLPAALAARYARVVEAVAVTLTPDVPAPELAPILEAVAAIERDAEATRRCVARLTGVTPEVFARGADLRARAPAQWWPEFDAAERFVLGLHARATLHEQESVRAHRWVLSTLQPQTEGGEEGAEATPEEVAEEAARPMDAGAESAPETGPVVAPR